ncbi:hypothetical protein ACH0F8_000589 [Enterococcus hirae]
MGKRKSPHKWTDTEIAYLKRMYAKKAPVKDIALFLKLESKQVINKASSMGISNPNTFSESEKKYIRDNYYTMNIREIADNLGRKNWQNVCRTAKKMGLTGNKGKIRHSDQPEPVDRRPKYSNQHDRSEAASAFMKEWHKTHEHPRGMLGKTHSKEYRERRRKIMINQWNDENSPFNSEKNKQERSERMAKAQNERIKNNQSLGYSRGKGGTRKDLGLYVRSRWEANFARYLNLLTEKGEIAKWEYEPDTFWFENIKRGTRSYTPDFKVWTTDAAKPIYYEVKGYMDKKSQTKLKRMAKYYPEIEIRMVQQKEYKEIEKNKHEIENWEEK